MCCIYNMKAKELIRLLQENGRVLDRVKGSHHIFVKNGKLLSVPVHGSKEIATGTLYSILKKADLK